MNFTREVDINICVLHLVYDIWDKGSEKRIFDHKGLDVLIDHLNFFILFTK